MSVDRQLGWVHFIGVGGVGMAGLAHLVADLGGRVTGSDAVETVMLKALKARGLNMRVGHGESLPGTPDRVVYSSAIGEDNGELKDARQRKLPCLRRGEYLGQLARCFKTVVAVAGSHGKTSTSAMLTHICKCAGLNPGYLVGGNVEGWNRSANAGDGSLLITEVDESDGTQVFTKANLAVILNVEDDHCWSFGGVEGLEKCFRSFATPSDAVLAWKSESTTRLFADLPQCTLITEDQMPEKLHLALPGWHNRIDGTMAVQAAQWLGIPRQTAVQALTTFPGVDRRLSVRATSSDGRVVLMDDYAHHPTELRALLDALQEGYPGHRRLVIFQPHRFERVRRYGRQFSQILSTADHCWVVAPFAAWVGDGAGTDPEEIVRGLPEGKGEYLPLDPKVIVPAVLAQATLSQDPVVIVTVGAGDIERCVSELAHGVREL